MDNLIDLHTHSYISDGSCSPTEVVTVAKRNNIKAIALTDHDSIYGIKEAYLECLKNNIELIPGIEISSLYKDGRILHILGLGIDITNKCFLDIYIKMKKSREESIPLLLKAIQSTHGLYINIKDLHSVKYDEYLSRYDIYRYILENNICTDAQTIWNVYLDPIPYGHNELIPIEDTLKMIKAAGGLSYLAHYNKNIGLGGFTNEEIESHIQYLISIGLNGIEYYYPSYKNTDYKFLDYLITKYNLHRSGGTDYHGSNRKNNDIGIGDGSLKIPYSLLFK